MLLLLLGPVAVICQMDLESMMMKLDEVATVNKPKTFQKSYESKEGESIMRQKPYLPLPASKVIPANEAYIYEGGLVNDTKVKTFTSTLCKKAKCDGADRGGKEELQKKVKVLPHEPDPKEVPGCGNPVCVVLDNKPQRFKSLCALNRKLSERSDQVNYVQKGDCYSIIDGGEAVKEKPWINVDPALQDKDCGSCRFHNDCGQPVVLNIELQRIIDGTSTAYGGEGYKPGEDGSKMPGVPIEFNSVCEAMIWIQAHPNVNIKTQVIGYAIGRKEEIYPDSSSYDETCLWTEWFDLNSPCFGWGDFENIGMHQTLVQHSVSGSQRICAPENVKEVQVVGGTETSKLTMTDIRNYGTSEQYKVKQDVQTINTMTTCMNSIQEKELPAPYIYAKDRGTKCLDYKQRYCCSSGAMFRPQSIEEFSRFFKQTLPIGPTSVDITWTGDGTNKLVDQVEIVVTVVMGTDVGADVTKSSNQGRFTYEIYRHRRRSVNKDIKIIVKASQEGVERVNHPKNGPFSVQKITATIYNTETYAVELEGSMYVSSLGNGGNRIKFLFIQKGENTMTNKQIGTITVITNENNVAEETKVLDEYTAGTSTTKYKYDKEISKEIIKRLYTKLTTIEHYKDLKGSFHTTSSPGGEETVKYVLTTDFRVVNITRENPGTTTKLPKQLKWWEKVMKLNQQINFGYFIESPPTATLFAECEWRDFISEDYPGKRSGSAETGFIEAETRHETKNIEKLKKHVCGDVNSNAHYIDAVSVDGQNPWYEMKTGDNKAPYEVYKLSPYFGYACNDLNSETKAYCKDMKVRYCCAKKPRAHWGAWGGWEACSAECGSGISKRRRVCNEKPGEESCFGVGGNIEYKESLTVQTRICNVNPCPKKFEWDNWSDWSRCSVSCGKGTTTRRRHCKSAIGTGKQCPSPDKNWNLYSQTVDCFVTECETFTPTQWSSWSSISVSCGVGVVTRTRKCKGRKSMKIVENKFCMLPGQPVLEERFRQVQKHKLRDCPVAGGWASWGQWEKCSQNCIPDPSEHTGNSTTKAVERRRQFCVNPAPSGGGKKCPKEVRTDGTVLKYSMGVKIEEKPCEHKDKGGTVEYCPVNCQYTEWGEWSACSFTCIKMGTGSHTYKPTGQQAYDNPAWITILNDDVSREQLPRRYRRSCKLRAEKNGGTCPQEMAMKGGIVNRKPEKGGQPYIEQNEDCELIDEHCVDTEKQPEQDRFKWPKATYPGDDPKKVGYCPVNCEYEDRIDIKNDCDEEQKKYTKNKDKPCYEPKIASVYTKDDQKKYDTLIKELMERLAANKTYNNVESVKTPKLWTDEEILTCLNDDEGGCTQKIAAYRAFREDVVNLWRLTTQNYKKYVKLPNIDGLYGGSACKRRDGRILTKYKDVEGKKNAAHDLVLEHNSCQIELCEMDLKNGRPNSEIKRKCIAIWGPWGPYGKCTKGCGDQGNVIRKRQCEDGCTKEKVDTSKCRPKIATEYNVTIMDQESQPCSPCPPASMGYWSQWSDWKLDRPITCSNEGGVVKMTRTRKCTPAKPGATAVCHRSYQGNTKGEETQEGPIIPLPPCNPYIYRPSR